jgi:hypothetical protein
MTGNGRASGVFCGEGAAGGSCAKVRDGGQPNSGGETGKWHLLISNRLKPIIKTCNEYLGFA